MLYAASCDEQCSATLTRIPRIPTSANLSGLRRVRKRRRTRGRRCQRVGSGRSARAASQIPRYGRGCGRIVTEPRTERQTAGTQKRPKEPSVRRSVSADASTCDSVPPYPGPRSRRRRCKHLRRRFRSVMAPSGKTNGTGGRRVWLWGYPRTSRLEAIPSALSTVRPRTRPRPVPATAWGQRSSGQRTSPGRTRIRPGRARR